jgi:hypothetical protein
MVKTRTKKYSRILKSKKMRRSSKRRSSKRRNSKRRSSKRRSRRDYGNFFRRQKEYIEKSSGKPGEGSKIMYMDSPKGGRIRLSNAQYKLLQDWSNKELNKIRRSKKELDKRMSK